MDNHSNQCTDIVFASWVATFQDADELYIWAQRNGYAAHPVVLTRLAELRGGITWDFGLEAFDSPPKKPIKRKLSRVSPSRPVIKKTRSDDSNVAKDVEAFNNFQDLERWAFTRRLLNDPMVRSRLTQLGGATPSTSGGSGGAATTSSSTSPSGAVSGSTSHANGNNTADFSDDLSAIEIHDLFDNIELDNADLEGLDDLTGYLTTKKYEIIRKGEKTFKNLAKDVTYKIKLDTEWRGNRLKDIYGELHDMFDSVMADVRIGLTDQDKGRVIINHPSLYDPIVVPLQNLGGMNSHTIMDTIEKVLQSHQQLAIDDSSEIIVGTIKIPKGGWGFP